MEDRRLLLFFLLALAILLGWQLLVPPPPPVQTVAPVATPGAAATPEAAPRAPAAEPEDEAEAEVAPQAELPPVAADAERRVTLEAEDFRAVFTNRGAQLVSFVLEEHRDEQGRPLDLVRARGTGPWPLGLVGPDLEPLPVNDALFAVERQADGEGAALRFVYRGPLGAAEKVVRVAGPGLLALELESGAPGWGVVLGPGLGNPSREELEARGRPAMGIYRSAGEVERVAAAKTDELVELPEGTTAWAGIADNYFLKVLVPQSPVAEILFQPVAVGLEGEGAPYRLTPFRSEAGLAPAIEDLPRDLRLVVRPEGARLEAMAYLGAAEYERLASLRWGLEEALDWGLFGFLARPLLWGLLWIHDHMVANYGWAIVLLTLGIRILLFPLTWKSQQSMQRMQELQPKMQAIRQKYRGKLRDKKGRMDFEAQRKMNEEMQELFRSEGASPYGGCFPILLQMPIFFALFYMLRSAVELRDAPWLGWVRDLSVPDPFFVLPVLMGVTQIYQMRLTPASGDPMQRRIMQLFPWLFTIFSLSFPAGLVLYWTVNNLVTIGQTLVLKKRQSTGEARRAPAGATRAHKGGAKR